MSHTNDPITNAPEGEQQHDRHGATTPARSTPRTASGAIVFSGALTGTTLGTFNNVEIPNNTITNVRAFRCGIALSNTANSLANQNLGVIANAVISCNTITGPGEGGSHGVRLFGFTSNPTITNNAIAGVDTGFSARRRTGTSPTRRSCEENSIAPTTTAAIDWQPAGPLERRVELVRRRQRPDRGRQSGRHGRRDHVDRCGRLRAVARQRQRRRRRPLLRPRRPRRSATAPQTCTAPGVCDAPDAPDGTTCDDANACSTNDQCTAGVCSGPGNTCGDGVIDGACGETCDDGAGNGTNLCCSATCGIVDTDTDTICDRDDPCTNGALATKHKLTATKLLTPAGNDKLSLKGRRRIPLTPTLTRVNGVRSSRRCHRHERRRRDDRAGGAYDSGHADGLARERRRHVVD